MVASASAVADENTRLSRRGSSSVIAIAGIEESGTVSTTGSVPASSHTSTPAAIVPPTPVMSQRLRWRRLPSKAALASAESK